MNKLTECVTLWLIRNEVIGKEEQELYQYAVESIVLTLVPFALTICLGLVMGANIACVALILPFMIIRSYSGGFHASKISHCFIMSCLLLTMAIRISQRIQFSPEFVVIVMIAAVCVCIFSPVISENKPLDDTEIRKNKKYTSVIALFFLAVSILLGVAGLQLLAVYIGVGIMIVPIMQLPCIISGLKRRYE